MTASKYYLAKRKTTSGTLHELEWGTNAASLSYPTVG